MTGPLECWKLMERSDKHWMQGVNLREKQGFMHLTSDKFAGMDYQAHAGTSSPNEQSIIFDCHTAECWYIVMFTPHTLSAKSKLAQCSRQVPTNKTLQSMKSTQICINMHLTRSRGTKQQSSGSYSSQEQVCNAVHQQNVCLMSTYARGMFSQPL